MADTESLGEAGVALAGGARGAARGRAPRARPDHHRSARARLRHLQAAQADRRHGRHRGARDPRLRGARRADDQHLHQLPDHPAAGARRASRHGRHRRRHLFQQRDGRAQQFRGRAVGAGRRADRPHAALRLPPRRAPRRHAGISSVAAPAARSRRLGRARRHRRPRRQQLLGGAGRQRHRARAQFRRAQALRRGAGELRLGRAVPHARRHARGADARRAPCRPPGARRRPTIGEADFEAFYAGYAAHGRQGRRRGVRRAAALAARDGAGSPACSTAGACTRRRR